jgi:hypothetical protein
MAGALIALGGLLPLLNRAISDEDEESGLSHYDMIPDFVKERNIVIMTGGKNYITIPLPYGYNVFYNFGEMTSDVISDTREVKDASMFMWGAVLGSFTPVPVNKRDTFFETLTTSLIPTEPLRFFGEISANRNYNNMAIYKEAFPFAKGEVPDSSLPMKNTPEWAKWTTGMLNDITGGTEVSKGWLDINPETLIYSIHRAGGGVSKLVERTFSLGDKLIFNYAGGKPTEEGKKIMEEYDVTDDKSIKMHTIPFVRRYFGESQDLYFSGEYYNIKEEVYTDVNVKRFTLSKRGVTDIKDVPKKEREEIKKLEKVMTAVDNAEKDLKDLREVEKELKNHNNQKDVQAAINAIDKKKTSIYKQVFKIYKENK